MCKLLVEHGSQWDRRDENGETPLYYAIKNDRGACMDYLISLGCNLANQSTRNMTLVLWATR